MANAKTFRDWCDEVTKLTEPKESLILIDDVSQEVLNEHILKVRRHLSAQMGKITDVLMENLDGTQIQRDFQFAMIFNDSDFAIETLEDENFDDYLAAINVDEETDDPSLIAFLRNLSATRSLMMECIGTIEDPIVIGISAIQTILAEKTSLAA